MTIEECAKRHDAIKADPVAWSKLEPRGLQPLRSDPRRAIELRNCTCGSTLGIRVSIEVTT